MVDTLKILSDTTIYLTSSDSTLVVEFTQTIEEVNRVISDTWAIGIISGLVAAIIFFFLIHSIKPHIKISKKICRSVEPDHDGNDQTLFRIKFINYTLFNIDNISIDVFLMEERFWGNAKNYTTNRLRLKRDRYGFISGCLFKDRKIHNNCVQVGIKDDLDSLWNGDHDWLQIQITTYHAKSGTRKVFVKKYYTPEDAIIDGKFKSGHTFNIISQRKRNKNGEKP